MSLTLSVVTEKVFISPFRSGSDGSHIQFYDDGCIAGPFQCRLAYQYTFPRIIVRLLAYSKSHDVSKVGCMPSRP